MNTGLRVVALHSSTWAPKMEIVLRTWYTNQNCCTVPTPIADAERVTSLRIAAHPRSRAVLVQSAAYFGQEKKI
jgi:hypothetical protein